jgi:hypothetical protein
MTHVPAVLLITLLAAPVAVPVYTDTDLARVSDRRAQTGGSSSPAALSGAPAERSRPAAAEPARRGEAYWRSQADKTRERVLRLHDRLEALRVRVDQRRRTPGVRPYSDPQVRTLTEETARLQARVRDLEDDLLDRARRDGALPGWLR